MYKKGIKLPKSITYTILYKLLITYLMIDTNSNASRTIAQ